MGDVIKLSYTDYDFSLFFEKPLKVYKFPVFTFRSVLGKELYKLSCVLKNERCENCPLNHLCVYSRFFSTPVSSEEIFKGNKKPHPFTLSVDLPLNKKVKKCTLSIRLIGDNYDFASYLYLALKLAGKKGIFKRRVKFSISSVSINGKPVAIEKDRLTLNEKPYLWQLNKEESHLSSDEKKITITFLTPLKIERTIKEDLEKKKELVRNPDYKELILNGIRRLKMLSHFYGSNEDVYIDIDEIAGGIMRQSMEFKPVSIRYYSFRQKKPVFMNGIKGTLMVEKKISPIEYSLLKGFELFGIGKATSFGFGKIKVEVI